MGRRFYRRRLRLYLILNTFRGVKEGRSPSFLSSPFPFKERGIKGVRFIG